MLISSNRHENSPQEISEFNRRYFEWALRGLIESGDIKEWTRTEEDLVKQGIHFLVQDKSGLIVPMAVYSTHRKAQMHRNKLGQCPFTIVYVIGQNTNELKSLEVIREGIKEGIERYSRQGEFGVGLG